MAPPTYPLNLDVEAISGICGSISIACWVVVFSPQILENFRRASADGLSLHFLITWLLGDVFNILGCFLQGVLPTMIILAVYYTIADIVLLGQCFYYRGFTWRDEVQPKKPKPAPPRRHAGEANEYTGLLTAAMNRERRGSDWSNLSPAVPMIAESSPYTSRVIPSTLQTILWNSTAVFMVCAAGVAGWFLSRGNPSQRDDRTHTGDDSPLSLSFWGQVFGWLCAALYLGSRLPQLLLNWRRKSTDGVSMLFFIFACLGNLTYVLSIFAYDPKCQEEECKPGEAGQIYGQYMLVNLSWLAGSLGTLLLDMGIFIQFFMYNKAEEDEDEEAVVDEIHVQSEDDEEDDDEHSIDGERWDPRPLLARGDSTFG